MLGRRLGLVLRMRKCQPDHATTPAVPEKEACVCVCVPWPELSLKPRLHCCNITLVPCLSSVWPGLPNTNDKNDDELPAFYL